MPTVAFKVSLDILLRQHAEQYAQLWCRRNRLLVPTACCKRNETYFYSAIPHIIALLMHNYEDLSF